MCLSVILGLIIMSTLSVDEYKEEKKKLFAWLLQWLQKDDHEPISFDISQMTIIMQVFGFKLESFKKTNAVENNCDGEISVNFTCSRSGMTSVLKKQTNTCKCPKDEDIEKSEFWTVTSCAPSSQEGINASYSSLLPTMSTSKIKTLDVLLNGTLHVINSATFDGKKKSFLSTAVSNSSPLSRSTSLDAFKSSIFKSDQLRKYGSWEVDPKTTPPTETSSPISSLSSSMNRVSLNSDKHNFVLQNLQSIQKLATETLEFIHSDGNATFVKPTYRKVSDITPVEKTQKSEKVIAPRRVLTPRRTQTTKKTVLPRVLTPTSANLKSTYRGRMDTPMPSISKQSTPNRVVVKATKSKIASYVGLSPKLVYNIAKNTDEASSHSGLQSKNVAKTKCIGLKK